MSEENKIYFHHENYSNVFGEFVKQFNEDMGNYFKDKGDTVATPEEVDKIALEINKEFQVHMSAVYPDVKIRLVPQFDPQNNKVELNLDPKNEEGFNLMKEAFGDMLNDFTFDKEKNTMYRYRSMVTVLSAKQVANLKAFLNVVTPKEGQYVQIKTVDMGESGIKSYLYLDNVLVKDLDSE